MKNKKGFTLIELLAVIVILGLLMAIAIPSVTKYITQSRKKTVTSTIGNYIGALVNDVNDLSYTFTEANTVYAVPIECIALERGGTNPFGAWHQANNAYWAYVLVQYNDQTSSYTYGYTFKDSAGYGLYPTSQAKLNEQGKQIQTGLSLSRPKTGKVTTITELKNWNGFVVNDTTTLIVLEAESEGNTGDGKTTCTLQQKGDNYTNVESEKTASLKKVKISGVEYKFKEGMTWRQWYSSKYNTSSLYLYEKQNVILNEDPSSYPDLSQVYRLTYDTLIITDPLEVGDAYNYPNVGLDDPIFEGINYGLYRYPEITQMVCMWLGSDVTILECVSDYTDHYILKDSKGNLSYVKIN